MQKHTFSVDEPVACLRFLTAFRKICDKNEVSEHDALKIRPYFLSGNPCALFDHMTEEARSNVSGFDTYPNTVQFFLRT